jgi:hypothetical protein
MKSFTSGPDGGGVADEARGGEGRVPGGDPACRADREVVNGGLTTISSLRASVGD